MVFLYLIFRNGFNGKDQRSLGGKGEQMYISFDSLCGYILGYDPRAIDLEVGGDEKEVMM